MMDEELLTKTERNVLALLGSAANLFSSDILSDGPTADQDLREFHGYIHALQQMIMSQAAARAYPDTYRLLGGVVNRDA